MVKRPRLRIDVTHMYLSRSLRLRCRRASNCLLNVLCFYDIGNELIIVRRFKSDIIVFVRVGCGRCFLDCWLLGINTQSSTPPQRRAESQHNTCVRSNTFNIISILSKHGRYVRKFERQKRRREKPHASTT